MSRILKNGDNQITQEYSKYHKGVDIVRYNRQLDYIISHSDGVVVEVKNDYNKTDVSGNSYGNYVKIKHSDGYYTLYAHLKYKSIRVLKGDKVKRGQIIGYMGNTGYSFGAHLHFEVIDSKNNKINPMMYIDSDLPNSFIKKDISYRVYYNNLKSWSNVVYNGESCGNIKYQIGGVQIKINDKSVKIKYKVHLKNIDWLPEVYKWDDTNEGYAGIREKSIDALAISVENHNILYRVMTNKMKWLPWVNGYDINDYKNGYAGNIGEEIIKIQIKIID